MSGLLQRAAEYRENRRKLHLVRAESADGFEELGGTPEERIAILEQIDQIINEHRVTIGPDTFRVNAKKRGIGLPIFVNLVAVLLVAGGAYYLIQSFADRESVVAGAATALASTEGRLLQTLREESDAQLAAKDDQISGIQGRLATISAEREELESNMNAELDSREEALRAEFQSALDSERDRLQGGGLSEAEIERRLADFQTQQQSELAAQLDAVRAQAEQELQDQEAALNALLLDAEQSLADAESERSDLETGFRDQEARLTEEFSVREAELTEERAQAVDLLAEMQAQQEQEQLVLDQIVAFYRGIQSDLTARDFDGAIAGTTALRAYLSEGPAAQLPTVQRRRRVELFLVESLEARIADERAAASPDVAALVESTIVIAHVTELVAAADGAYGAAEFENARTLYLAALSEIPAVRVGYDRLMELEQQAVQAESDRIARLVQQGNELYRQGSFQDAAAAYGEALVTLPSSDTGLLSRVLDAGYQLLRTNDITALRVVQAELETARATLADQQVLVEQQATQLVDSAGTASALQVQLAALQTQLDAVPATTEPASDVQEDGRIAALQLDLSDSNEAIAGRDEQIAALRSSITDLDTLLAESRAEADQLRQEGESSSEYAQSLLDDQETRLADQERLLGQLETQLAESADTAATSEMQVAALETDLSDRDATIAGRDEQITAFRLSITDLDTLLAESRADTDRLQQEAESFSGYVEFHQEQQDLADEIIRYKERFAASDAGGSTADGVSPLELLETKLVILRIIGSESIRAQYPDLTDQLNAYLDALVAEQRGAATETTLAGVNVVLDLLLDDAVAGRAIRADQVPPGLAGTGDETGKFFSLLERLAGPE